MSGTYDIVGLGYCGLDYLSILPRIPIDDKVEILESLIQGGGPAATAIFAAQRLGAKTAFISAVGDDERGNGIISGLAAEGVNCDNIVRQKGRLSPAAFCWVEESSGRRSIAWTRGSTVPLDPSDIPERIIASAKILHLDGHHTAAATAAARIARKNGVRVVLDAGTVLPGIEELMKNTDIIVASEKFAAAFTGMADFRKALEKLHEFSSLWSVVTLGSDGCIGFDGEAFEECPAFNVKVIDTTGAGDVFHGAFVYRYLRSESMSDIMRFASAVAALKCTKFGGRTGIPDLKTTEKFLEQK